MIQSLRIKNYQCFADLSLDNLARVNVIVGQGGTGKTALLDAIFFVTSVDPDSVLRSRNFRGTIGPKKPTTPAQYLEMFGHLFRGHDPSVEVSISVQGTEAEHSASVVVKLEEEVEPSSDPKHPMANAPERAFLLPVSFEWKRPGMKQGVKMFTLVSETGDLLSKKAKLGIANSFHPAGFQLDPASTATDFSESVTKSGQKDTFMSTLRKVFPYIGDVSVESDAGRWMLHVTVPGVGAAIPAGMHSSGAQRLLQILVAVASCPRGLVFIDELENGFHYTLLGKVWEGIVAFARQYDVQLYVITHSMDCLRAASSLIREDPEQFTLIQMSREDADGPVRVKHAAGHTLTSALESGFELR